ncbi:hypothetical protein ACFQ5J_10925 [Lacticaseibacillus baoqingensis]|uniref:DUF3899 domain-containing protein n=1 Tax=Lacticaseibacillus baoqingensis TaxID=2486013 RepID=A0ABW4E7U9_9LACO|nr:hypothetical protein [Lacticaseibacillus baoqingensis]
MENQSTPSRFQRYLASMQRNHFKYLFSPIPLLYMVTLIFIVFVMFSNLTEISLSRALFTTILAVLVFGIDVFFYKLIIDNLVYGPLSGLVVPKKYADVQKEARAAYERTEKHWDVVKYGSVEVSRTFNDQKARWAKESVQEDWGVKTWMRLWARFFIGYCGFILGPVLLFLCPPEYLNF